MQGLINKSKLLALTPFEYDISRLRSYKLDDIKDPRERIKTFLDLEWGVNAPAGRRGVIMPPAEEKLDIIGRVMPRDVFVWKGKHWSGLSGLETNVRSFTRLNEEEAPDKLFEELMRETFEKNYEFMKSEGLTG
jgi:hypothetical protein